MQTERCVSSLSYTARIMFAGFYQNSSVLPTSPGVTCNMKRFTSFKFCSDAFFMLYACVVHHYVKDIFPFNNKKIIHNTNNNKKIPSTIVSAPKMPTEKMHFIFVIYCSHHVGWILHNANNNKKIPSSIVSAPKMHTGRCVSSFSYTARIMLAGFYQNYSIQSTSSGQRKQ